ncbi:MAG TPA: hypothetical protein VKM55_12080 [Candidatus Lokiarchaeia archaeon]|nr:hypothetical protein [Candidatus Lokiarchaeia archaeon]
MAKKETKSDSWASVENIAVIMGTWSWVLVLVAAAVDIAWGIYGLSVWGWSFSQLGVYSVTSTYVWYLIAGVVELVLLFIYVLKTFVPKCKAKDWEFLLADGIFSPKFPKMLFFGILLFVFSPAIDYFGGALVIVPVILLLIFAPKSGSK